jgi:ATP-dependent Clp protease ATP-binding subunit ClpA
MVDFNKFTSKAAEAVQEAHDLAVRMKHTQITLDHVLISMLGQNE